MTPFVYKTTVVQSVRSFPYRLDVDTIHVPKKVKIPSFFFLIWENREQSDISQNSLQRDYR